MRLEKSVARPSVLVFRVTGHVGVWGCGRGPRVLDKLRRLVDRRRMNLLNGL